MAMQQSAIDANCRAEDFCQSQNKIVLSTDHPNARKYLTLPFYCNLISYGNNIVASVNEEMHYFNEWDPEGLIECGTPPDAYSGEIEDICDLIDETTTTGELAETISSKVIKIWSTDYLKHGTDIMRIARKVDSFMNNIDPDTFSGWLPYEDGKTISTQGSENGIIIKDDEHDKGSRIMLEQGCGNIPYAITCGIYGLMCHTTYASNYEEAEKKYENMKNDLQVALEKYHDNQDALIDWIDEFTTKY
jgi:hypothetical protein